MAPVFIFLAAKVEEQPRRLEHVVKITYKLLHPQEQMDIQTKPEIYTEKFAEEGELMVTHENVLLQTLAFDIRVEHPHTHVIRCCQIIRCEKEVSHAAYALASCALHFTKVCIQYRPILVACMCIDVSSKWSNTHIPLSKENLPWYHYMDPSVTLAEIQQVSADFLDQVNKYPDKIRQKIRSQVMGQGGSFSLEAAGGPVAKASWCSRANIRCSKKHDRQWYYGGSERICITMSLLPSCLLDCLTELCRGVLRF